MDLTVHFISKLLGQASSLWLRKRRCLGKNVRRPRKKITKLSQNRSHSQRVTDLDHILPRLLSDHAQANEDSFVSKEESCCDDCQSQDRDPGAHAVLTCSDLAVRGGGGGGGSNSDLENQANAKRNASTGR